VPIVAQRAQIATNARDSESMACWRDARGQATSEYVALVALVAAVLALAAGLTSGGVAGRLLAGLQAGICRVSGAVCKAPAPADADLAPCPLERTTRRESLDGAFELADLGQSGTLTTVRTSDGRVTVSLLDGSTARAQIGLGLHVSLGGRTGDEASAGLGASVISGRSWTLPNATAARAFVDRYGSKATIGGKAVDALRSRCSVLCDAIGWHPHAELPPPDERYTAQGGLAELNVPLVVATATGSAGALVGARTAADGSSTWFLQVDARYGIEATFGSAVPTLGEERQAVVSYALDAQGRPSQLVIHGVTRASGRGKLRGAHRGGSIGVEAGGQLVTEVDGTLDLHDARNRAVAEAFVDALKHPWASGELQRRAAALHARFASTGVVDRRTYALTSSAFALGAKFAVGERVGADFERTHEGMRLLSAETRLPGLPFLPRDDCRIPVPSA
jgi:hypothetical protein